VLTTRLLRVLHKQNRERLDHKISRLGMERLGRKGERGYAAINKFKRRQESNLASKTMVGHAVLAEERMIGHLSLPNGVLSRKTDISLSLPSSAKGEKSNEQCYFQRPRRLPSKCERLHLARVSTAW
jgi:hypothetical protein